ncbi:MAG: DNA methyltransferase [Myxococcota bacterium]
MYKKQKKINTLIGEEPIEKWNATDRKKEVIVNKERFLAFLDDLLNLSNLNEIKIKIYNIRGVIANSKSDKIGLLNITANGDTMRVNHSFLQSEIEQILETHTIERTKYYIRRLKKSLSEVKTGKINDLNLNKWKEYEDIITDSLWVLGKRDNSGAHTGDYWGNFIPQIPNQLLQRYTKRGEWVLDPFLGSGTTLIECRRLGRNGIGVELQEKVAKAAENLIANEINKHKVQTKVIVGDSTSLDFKESLRAAGVETVQFVIMHPPYWDIIKFSDDERDLSRAKGISGFLDMLGRVVDNSYDILDRGRYLALVIGDKYSKGEWIPLGFYCMQEVMKRGFLLKSVIVKNFDETKGKMNQKELWRYRALVGGFYVFKHEYIFLFQKSAVCYS